MVSVAKLSADLDANISGFETGLSQADKILGDAAKSWSNSLNAIEGQFKSLGQTVLGFLAVDKLLSDFKSVAEQMDEAGKSADRLGISVESFSTLSFIARQNNIDVTTLEKSIKKMDDTMVQAARGSNTAAQAFNILGLNVKSLINESPDKAFIQISTALANIQNPAVRASTGLTIFGKTAGDMITLGALGQTSLAELANKAQEVGQVFDGVGVAKARAFNDELTTLNDTYRGLLMQLGDEGGFEALGTAMVNITNLAIKLADGFNHFSDSLHDFSTIITGGGEADISLHGLQQDINNTTKALAYWQGMAASGQTGDWFDRNFGENAADRVADLTTQLKKLNDEKSKRTNAGQEDTAFTDRFQSRVDEYFKKPKPATPEQLAPATPDKTADTLLDNLQQESDKLELQVDLYGQKAGAIAAATKQAEIADKLDAAGIELTDEQLAQEQLYLKSIEANTNALEDLKKADQERKQLLDGLGNAFESAFEKAVEGGNKFHDIMQSLLQDIEKLVLKASIEQPFEDLIKSSLKGSSSGSGSSIGSVISGIWDLLPSFDVGSDYVPQDMVAKIHKGERILTADENANGLGGSSSTLVNVTVINNTPSKVSQSSSQNGSGTDLQIMIDQAVATNITKTGSKTNQALSQLSSRSLIKR